MTEDEFRTGELEDGTLLGQPFDYVAEAARTLSPSWHGDKLSKGVFLKAVNEAIGAGNKLDQVKKTLFYGRDNNLIAVGQNDLGDEMLSIVSSNAVHGIIGVVTEATELLEALRNGYNGDGLDAVNVKEELGDLFWYVAILAKEFGFTFHEIQRVNIAKLKARYPDKFTADNANERDLQTERYILEEALPPAILPTMPVGGPEAVLATEASADAAFNAIAAVRDDSVDASVQFGGNAELSKGIGERLQDMPGENLARQPIRKKDA